MIASSGIRAALAVVIWTGFTGISAAQFPPPPPPAGGGSSVRDRWPEPPRSSQSNPQAAPPSSSPAQPAAPRRQAAPPAAADDAAPKPAAPQPAANVVACSGVFAKELDASQARDQVRLAQHHVRRRRRSGRFEDQGFRSVPERSAAPPRGAVEQRGVAQRHVDHRDQRQVAVGRAQGIEARPSARRGREAERQAVQGRRVRCRRLRRRCSAGRAAR